MTNRKDTMIQFFPSGLWEGSSLQTLWRQDGRDRACRWGTLWKQDREFPTVRWPGLSSRWVRSPSLSWWRRRTCTAAWRGTSGRCLAALPCPGPQAQTIRDVRCWSSEGEWLFVVVVFYSSYKFLLSVHRIWTSPAGEYQQLLPRVTAEIPPSEHSSQRSLCWWGPGLQSLLRHPQYLVRTQ